jgi:SagB-type dehydrogenase family enzyme
LPAPKALAQKTLIGSLVERRTWRTFGRARTTTVDLATLLRHTFGVQRWGIVDGLGRVALKTSPSGGACHPIEAYVLIRRVATIPPGFYHYESDRHSLTRVRASGARAIRTCLQAQPWYDQASFLVFLCPIFARTAWRYPTPRAYRSVLIEAGHLGQTFCLVATALGLAPFTTLAVNDLKVDETLGLDGHSQGVIYVVGCGTPPVEGWRSGVPLRKRSR